MHTHALATHTMIVLTHMHTHTHLYAHPHAHAHPNSFFSRAWESHPWKTLEKETNFLKKSWFCSESSWNAIFQMQAELSTTHPSREFELTERRERSEWKRRRRRRWKSFKGFNQPSLQSSVKVTKRKSKFLNSKYIFACFGPRKSEMMRFLPMKWWSCSQVSVRTIFLSVFWLAWLHPCVLAVIVFWPQIAHSEYCPPPFFSHQLGNKISCQDPCKLNVPFLNVN